jgi:hypothetical protein
VPGNGDTANIPNGIAVTVTDDRTVGASGPNGSVALTLNNTGQVIIAAGGTLHLRGNTTFTAAAVHVNVMAGGAWEFDSSAASSPGTTYYTFGPIGNYVSGTFQTSGTAASHAAVRSNAGGGAGQFSNNGTNSGINFQATYTDFLRIGNAASSGWTIRFVNWYVDPNHAVRWNVTNSTFTACGSISAGGTYGVDPGGFFIHDYNVHSATQGNEIFTGWLTDNATVGAGIREMKGNVFDVSATRSTFYPGGFTISGNYFADAVLAGGYNAWASWTNNFIRYSDWWGQTGNVTWAFGDVNDSYLFVDSDWGNPHMMLVRDGLAANLNGIVYGQAGTALGPPGPNDSGELYFLSPSSVPTTFGVFNSILLPNMSGYSSLEIGSMLPAYPNAKVAVEHNVWFGGWGRNVGSGHSGFPALQVGEGRNGPANSVLSFRSNILWNPQLTGYAASFYKLADVSYSAVPTVDYCAPASCDYNTGYGHTPLDTAHAQYVNQGKGYVAAFSSAPGKHDLDVNPMFVDWQRSVELFDSKYLGNTPAVWSAGATYNTGDFVRNSRADVYWGLPVNYRYINAGACAGTNPEPGTGSHWRDCWEWASLFRLREGIRNQQLLDDQVIGLHGEDIVTALIKWIRAGYAPTNPLLLGAAHDGFDIGATPVVFLSPAATIAPYTGPAPIVTPDPEPTIFPRGRVQ